MANIIIPLDELKMLFDFGVVSTNKVNTIKIHTKPLRKGQVIGHPRLSANVWTLVLKGLSSAFPEVKL